ncbi:MAG: molybdopterin-dependent oxidoreductase [Terriglobia bacterium]
MRRRDFIIASAAALSSPVRRLWADHHFASSFPLVVEFDLASLQGRYTRNVDFYIRNHFEAPEAAAQPFIAIEGEVERPLRLGMDDLRHLPEKRIGAVLECAGDPVKAVSLVSDGLWRGWPLHDVISPAKPRATGRYAHLAGRDGFARSVPTSWLMNDGLLATSLNGSPLGRNHGAPWRALIPGWYGVNSVKWLEKITLAQTPLPPEGNTYLELWREVSGSVQRKPLPPVQVKSVITSPANGAVLRRGKLRAGGLAWSGSGKIASVHVSGDGGGHWHPATIDAGSSRYDWVRWNAALELNQPGVVELASKAVDSAGNSQPPRRDPCRVDYYAYNVWDRIRCIVV